MVIFGEVVLYFSYKTLIAFEDNEGLTISKNEWSKTTGKHLNSINTDKDKRIDQEQFEIKFREFCFKHFRFAQNEILNALE